MIVTTWLEQKRQYRRYRARVAALPGAHRTAVAALERYLLRFGPGKAGRIQAMLDDLADLFEQSAADGSSVRDFVGDDPVEFAETVLRNYPEGRWVTRERDRLTRAMNEAATLAA